jgi:outer membrane protein OmpA-like peptidoglycan-associated protein
MRYSMLATALSLALGSGTALASYTPDPQDSEDPTDNAAQPASPANTQKAGDDQKADSNLKADSNDQQADATDRAKNIDSVDLLFDTASADLENGARHDLLTVARWAKCNEKGAVILEGHADPRGTQAYNMQLSGERAAAVRAKLIEMGVPSERIVITLYGENGDKKGEDLAQDRRVTVRAAAIPVQGSDITASR